MKLVNFLKKKYEEFGSSKRPPATTTFAESLTIVLISMVFSPARPDSLARSLPTKHERSKAEYMTVSWEPKQLEYIRARLLAQI